MLMISDANALIDLEEGELIEQLFKLPYDIYCFALALAKSENCPLLSGDQALRKAADAEAVEVYGTIGLLNA